MKNLVSAGCLGVAEADLTFATAIFLNLSISYSPTPGDVFRIKVNLLVLPIVPNLSDLV